MITINWKTYKQWNRWGSYSFVDQINNWISEWFLEEVKENKEHPMIKCVRADLLREELDKMKTENTDTSDEYTQWVLNTCGYLLDLLSSLETKEEPVPPTDKWREQYIADHPEELQLQFTPWQMIEVSNDGEKWEKNPRKFVCFGGSDHFISYITADWKREQHWKYARPLPQEDIELLPEFKSIINAPDEYTQSLWYQVELLTNAVNQLLKANNHL